jgi:hypothetical protein
MVFNLPEFVSNFLFCGLFKDICDDYYPASQAKGVGILYMGNLLPVYVPHRLWSAAVAGQCCGAI